MMEVKEILKITGKKSFVLLFPTSEKIISKTAKGSRSKTVIIMFEHDIISENLSSCENYFLMSITKLN